jgi:hypothetical protein
VSDGGGVENQSYVGRSDGHNGIRTLIDDPRPDPIVGCIDYRYTGVEKTNAGDSGAGSPAANSSSSDEMKRGRAGLSAFGRRDGSLGLLSR